MEKIIINYNTWRWLPYKIWQYIWRVLLRHGPHGKHCRCGKWGIYVSLGCPNPSYKLDIYPKSN